jgi:hypothetical protein
VQGSGQRFPDPPARGPRPPGEALDAARAAADHGALRALRRALRDRGHAANPLQAKAPRDYRTGFKLPVRDGLPAATEADREQAAEQARALQQTFEKGQAPRRWRLASLALAPRQPF